MNPCWGEPFASSRLLTGPSRNRAPMQQIRRYRAKGPGRNRPVPGRVAGPGIHDRVTDIHTEHLMLVLLNKFNLKRACSA